VARALIVGCGCRGRALGRRLAAAGWEVRGTARTPGAAEDVVAAGLEGAVSDPDRPGSVLDQVADVTVVFWLLGSATGESQAVSAIHGPRLERLLEKLVDSPVRGFVYETSGTVRRADREHGAGLVRAAGERWRIPVALVDADPGDWEAWTEAMLTATERLIAQRR
jgi:nucleoside-diphosphate-sugar epimerase